MIADLNGEEAADTASDIAKGWGESEKLLYVNYPRFTNLNEPANPRLAFITRLKKATSELVFRDAGDLLDPMRMVLDDFAMQNLRRAIEITGKGLQEGMKAARPGLSTLEVMQTVDYVYRYRGATLGFPTSVSREPPEGREPEPHMPEGFIQYVSRSGGETFTTDDLLHIDTGAAFRHFSADVQRTIPIRGTLDPDQRRLYEVALDVQKTVIEMVRPGVTWWELHNTADRMLRESGGFDEYWTYGIGHFIGMEVHDEGDYESPLLPGMVLAIEQGVAPPNGPRVAFGDDVLVTTDGFEWLSRIIPLEVDPMERMLTQESSLAAWVGKR